MGIEGQFAGLAAPTRRQPAFARDGRGKDYLYDIQGFAMLERDQEYALAKRWRERGDRDAADQLVTSHLRLAVKIAMGYRGYGLPVSEIISEGNIGLMQALNRFEPEKGFRFATYAMWWIRASIQDYILRSWSLVKIGTTANQKRLFFKLRSAKNKIAAFESGDLRPDQVASIAKSLDVTNQDVIDMNRRLGGDKSINAPLHEDGETGEWQDHLVDQSPSPEAIVVEQDDKEHQHSALIAAIDVLDDRERRIFEARHLVDEPLTLEELAANFNVSRERIRQIEVRAFEKVRKAARNLATKAPAAMLESWGA
jgi:RNA polymerase sigma-32 factor